MFTVSIVGHTAHIKPIVHFLLTVFQHCVVDDCNSFRYLDLQFIFVFWKGMHNDQSFYILPQKEIKGFEIWRPGRPGHENAVILPKPSNPSLRQCYIQKLSNLEALVWWHPILYENEVILFLTQPLY